MNISEEVLKNIMNRNEVGSLRIYEAQIFCGSDGNVNHGDVISNLDNPNSREKLHCRCAGAKMVFGDAVFIAFNVDGTIKIIKGKDCDKEFPFEKYESPIKM